MNNIRIVLGLIGVVVGIFGAIIGQKESRAWALVSVIWAASYAITGVQEI